MWRTSNLQNRALLVACLVLISVVFSPAERSLAQSTWRPKTAPSRSSQPTSGTRHQVYTPADVYRYNQSLWWNNQYWWFHQQQYQRRPPAPADSAGRRTAALLGFDFAPTDLILAQADNLRRNALARTATGRWSHAMVGGKPAGLLGSDQTTALDTSLSQWADVFAATSDARAAQGLGSGQPVLASERRDWTHDLVGGVAIRRADLSLFNEAFLQYELNVEDGRSHDGANVLVGPTVGYGFSWDGANFISLGVSYLTLSSVDRQPALPGASAEDRQRVSMGAIPVDIGYSYHGSAGKGAWVAGGALSLVPVSVDVEYSNPVQPSYDYAFEFSGFGLGAALYGGYERQLWEILGISVGGRYDFAESAELGTDGEDWLWATTGGRLERATVHLSGPSLVFGITLGQ